jgi:hypothetical protein
LVAHGRALLEGDSLPLGKRVVSSSDPVRGLIFLVLDVIPYEFQIVA